MKKERHSQSGLERLLARIKRLSGWTKLEPPGFEPENPFAGVRSPNKHGPRSRSGAVALVEPIEDEYRSFPPRKV